MVSLRYFAPAEPLRGYVSSYYRFDTELPAFADLLRAEMAQIRITTRGGGSIGFPDGRDTPSPRVMLNGAGMGPTLFRTVGPTTVYGIGLLPLGWAALIGDSADRYADTVASLPDVVSAIGESHVDRLACAADDAAAVAALDAIVASLAAHARPVPGWFIGSADAWLIGARSPAVDDLVAAADVSSRQVERLMRRIYGGPPKLLARKYRALQAAVRLGTGVSRDWLDAAGEAFYDQPHFIREFRQFVGLTPQRFLAGMAPVMRLTIANRRRLPSLPRLALYS
ncbi:MAG: AraC family transcriptional regulator [Alphaproteobacteria bacterium]|nr:AraC family transcriptional regulator [Alphaproteobacteria bacterium]